MSVKVLVVGCGHMGRSHALAYSEIQGFEVVGVVNRSAERRKALSQQLGNVPEFDNFETALDTCQPDAVSINTYTETHAPYAIHAMTHGAHVFIEKPLGVTPEEAQTVVETAKKYRKQLVVGYILRHHPSWIQFTQEARKLGTPLVMRLNLNQQSAKEEWRVHKNLMNSLSPIVDCGVHYVDVMCQMTKSEPVRVSAIGARLTEELNPGMHNYGQLQVVFKDGSIGWYESGWGPMMSETAYFIKDVIGPKGSVSIVPNHIDQVGVSSDIQSHTAAESLRIHHSALDQKGHFVHDDEVIDLSDAPGHQELCHREQEFFLESIQNNLDLSQHHKDAVNSLRIVCAADESCRTGNVVRLV